MNYEVKVIYGMNTAEIQLNDVSSVEFNDGIYTVYNSDGNILFTSPKESVVYINKK